MIADGLVALHTSLAMAFKQPALVISEQEAWALGSALGDVLDKHGLNLGSKTGPLIYLNFAMVAMSIYAPRLIAIEAEIKARAAKRVNPTPGAMPQAQQHSSNVVSFGELPIINSNT